jgi:hypothetical protein
MSRLRIRLSNSEIDRKVASYMVDAERILLSALRDCEGYMRSAKNPVEVARTRGVIRDLKKMLGMTTGVRRIRPIYDVEDTDLTSSKPKPPREPKSKLSPTPTSTAT